MEQRFAASLSLIHIYRICTWQLAIVAIAASCAAGVTPAHRAGFTASGTSGRCASVSYTHLDVYKRQVLKSAEGSQSVLGRSGFVSVKPEKPQTLQIKLHRAWSRQLQYGQPLLILPWKSSFFSSRGFGIARFSYQVQWMPRCV